MSEGELWSILVTAINPDNAKAMPAALQSTIHLLETELAKARAALKEIQPNTVPTLLHRDELAFGAVAAYRENLIGRATDFYYGTSRLTSKELGLAPVVREVQVDSDEESSAGEEPQCPVVIPPKRASLVDVLSNNLILDHMAPYLSVSGLFALAATSRFLRSMVMETPYVFRHLDLTQCRGAQLPDASPIDSGGQVWRSERMDESLTEDEFYSGPVRGIFQSLEQKSILRGVRTLVLDGLSVPADLVADIVLTDRFNVNILSIRGCHHLNERKLMQVLEYAVRPTRPEGTPRVKGIYLFTPVAQSQAATRSKYRDWWSSRCARKGTAEKADNHQEVEPYRLHPWYSPSGRRLKRVIEEGWAQTIQKCEGIIAFDAVLCRGPRHNIHVSSADQSGSQQEGQHLGPALATVALGPKGCDVCHSSPEGPAIWGQSPDGHFPLLTPPPFHSSSIAAAKRPVILPNEHPVMISRCEQCLVNRWCHRCNKWYCGSCLPNPEHVRSNLSPHQTAVSASQSSSQRLERGVSKDCWECGPTCGACKVDYQRTCQKCQGVYCIEHNEGCSSTMCDWCNASSRHRVRELY